MFTSAACLPVLISCIELCYRAQTEPIKFGPELAAIAVIAYAVVCMAFWFMMAGVAWMVFGRRRIRARSAWSTLILGVGHGFVTVGIDAGILPGAAFFIGPLVIAPILFQRAEQSPARPENEPFLQGKGGACE